ncbi:MAG: hypothetical protein EOO60_01995 [Hymenobacter sp.]|nr:MAG: hypothetical protein EOO60_01995 [Hymenobacter sp.]
MGLFICGHDLLRLPYPLPRRAALLGAQVRHVPGPVELHDEDGGVNLYHCAGDGRGFFVEVGVDDGRGQAVVLRSFVSSVPLEDYSYWVKLPEL